MPFERWIPTNPDPRWTAWMAQPVEQRLRDITEWEYADGEDFLDVRNVAHEAAELIARLRAELMDRV